MRCLSMSLKGITTVAGLHFAIEFLLLSGVLTKLKNGCAHSTSSRSVRAEIRIAGLVLRLGHDTDLRYPFGMKPGGQSPVYLLTHIDLTGWNVILSGRMTCSPPLRNTASTLTLLPPSAYLPPCWVFTLASHLLSSLMASLSNY